MTRVEIPNVVCVDENYNMSRNNGPANAILVDGPAMPLDIWIHKNEISEDSQVRHLGDAGTLVLQHPSLITPEQRRLRIDRVIGDARRKIEVDLRVLEERGRAAALAQRRAEEALRAAPVPSSTAAAPTPAAPAPTEDEDPAVRRWKNLDLRDGLPAQDGPGEPPDETDEQRIAEYRRGQKDRT